MEVNIIYLKKNWDVTNWYQSHCLRDSDIHSCMFGLKLWFYFLNKILRNYLLNEFCKCFQTADQLELDG